MSTGIAPPLTVAWITDFPIEWLSELPESLRHLPRAHPLTWQRVLLDELEKHRGLTLHIIVLRKGLDRDVQFVRNRVNFHVLRVPPKIRASTFFWWDTFLVRRKMREIHPDLVHAWGTERGAGLVGGRLGLPCILTIQGLLTWLGEKVPLNIYHKFSASLERLSFQRATLVTTEPRFAIDYFRDRFPRVSVLQVEHAPNPIFFDVQREPAQGKVHFLFCGLISHLKGVDLLLEALATLPEELDWQCTVIGNVDPAFSRAWEKLRAAQKRVSWRENLTPAQIAEELARATLFLFPTRADTSPNAVKEAVVAGVPVLATAIGGIPDYVVPGKNGLLFIPPSSANLRQAINEALAHPLFHRGLVDTQTLAQARTYLSPAKMAARFLEAYAGVAGKSRIPDGPR